MMRFFNINLFIITILSMFIISCANKSSYLHKACDDGYAQGCFNLGYMYYQGEGVPVDFKKAGGLYSKACDGGDAQGCILLGGMYVVGEGVPVDYDKALKLFKKTCELGNQWGCDAYQMIYDDMEK